MQLKESMYNVKINLLRGKLLLYNSLSRALCVLDPEEVSALDRLEQHEYADHGAAINGEFRDLCSQGFLLPDKTDELGIIEKMYREHRNDPSVMNLTVCSTLACNFGCDYCFQGQDKSAHVMTEEVREGIVDLYRKVMEVKPEMRQVQFVWYGGEPLVKKNVIYDLSDRLINLSIKRNIKHTASMVSNGYLMDREVAQQLSLRGLRMVQITLDGSEKFHDARRHLLSKKGTYQRIVGNIEQWIDDLPINVNIRVNIDDRNKDDIVNLIDDLVARGLSGRNNLKLYFSPVEAITRGCHNIADKTMAKLNYGQFEAELYRYTFEKGLCDLPYPPKFLGVCSALRPNDYIVVPSGDVHKCWDTVSFPHKKVGTVFDLDELLGIKENLARQRWDEFDPFSNEICSSCKLLPNCSSYCAHKFVYPEDAAGDSVLPCPPMKYSLNERLVLKAEKEGVITRSDYTPEGIRTDPHDLTPRMHTRESMTGAPLARPTTVLPVLQY